MRRHELPVFEEGQGRLFSARATDVAEALVREAAGLGVELLCDTQILAASREGERFRVDTSRGAFHAESLVLALGGLAWPQLGATNLAFALAERFGLKTTKLRPGLVPLLAGHPLRGLCQELSGVSLEVRIAAPHAAEGALLFTHRGISGPAVLDASLAWREGQALSIDLLPGVDLAEALSASPRMDVGNRLGQLLPRRLAARLRQEHGWVGAVANLSNKRIQAMGERLHGFVFKPSGAAGFAKAEVTLGGVEVGAISSQTMEAKTVPGLFCVGEALDVTGRLGGFNLQWAWSSGHAAGQNA